MKVITIGRSDDNQIVIDDNQDLVSRKHAVLRIYDSGKMEIVSSGINGTFVNGFLIKPNVPYKVTRKDVISFAHVRQLDWSLVPDPLKVVRWIVLGVGAILVTLLLIFVVWKVLPDGLFRKRANHKQEVQPREMRMTEEKESDVQPKDTFVYGEKRVPIKKKPNVKKEEEKQPETPQEEPETAEESSQNQVFF